MESFVLHPMTWPALRALSRNPLVRTSDRIEAAVITFAFLIIIAAAAGAGAVGTMVHDSSAHLYAEEARTRHLVVATAVVDSAPAPASPKPAFTVYAWWQLNGTYHAGGFTWDKAVKADNSVPIWVDNNGNQIGPPSPASRAVADAVTVAIMAWLTVILAVAVAVGGMRVCVARMRDTQWERDIRCLVGNDGGRTNTSQ